LELLVHLDPNLLPSDLKLITIKIPEELSFEILTKDGLPKNWKSYPAPFELGEIGEKWVFSKRTLVLKVPSVIIPEESNILINPIHGDFHKIEMIEMENFLIDDRLIKKPS